METLIFQKFTFVFNIGLYTKRVIGQDLGVPKLCFKRIEFGVVKESKDQKGPWVAIISKSL